MTRTSRCRDQVSENPSRALAPAAAGASTVPDAPPVTAAAPVDARRVRTAVAPRLARLLGGMLGPHVPLQVRAWDGSRAALSSSPSVTVDVRSRRAVRYLLAAPNQIGLARAYVAGDLSLDGDPDHALSVLFDALDPAAGSAPFRVGPAFPARLADAAALWGIGLPPRPPAAEARLGGARHSRSRDRRAIGHHYDVGNDFYRLLLGSSMTYSCAYWTQPGQDLLSAQTAKHDLVAAKLGLRPGHRLLDVGCGWGSFLLHAATRYDVQGVGVTLSGQQAELARQRVRAAGAQDRVTIEHCDYRDLPGGSFDAIASVGMAEHVGTQELHGYARRVHGLLEPGGRLLHHTIASRSPEHGRDAAPADTFIARYVFPDGQLQPLHVSVTALECAGLEVRDVQALREHYPPTLRSWTSNLRQDWTAAVGMVGAQRARVWELYLAASALAFERDRIGVNQILAVRPTVEGASLMPPGRPEAWRAAT